MSRLSDVVVSVLATEPSGRGFKAGRDDDFLRAIKIYSAPSFGEVKPEAPRRNILRHLKNHLGSFNKNTSQDQTDHFARSSYLLPDESAGRIAREIWWKNQQFSVDIIPPWFSILIYHLGDEH
jgi:hypothetical protein